MADKLQLLMRIEQRRGYDGETPVRLFMFAENAERWGDNVVELWNAGRRDEARKLDPEFGENCYYEVREIPKEPHQ